MEVLPFCSCCHCVRKPQGRRGAAAPGIVTDPINQTFSCCIAFPLHHICPVLFLCYTHLMTEVEMGLLCSWGRGNQCSLFTIRGDKYCLAMPEHSVAAGSWNITPKSMQLAAPASEMPGSTHCHQRGWHTWVVLWWCALSQMHRTVSRRQRGTQEPLSLEQNLNILVIAVLNVPHIEVKLSQLA